MPASGFWPSKNPDDYRDRSSRAPRAGRPAEPAPRHVWLLGWAVGAATGAVLALVRDSDLLVSIGPFSIFGALIATALWRRRQRREPLG